MDDPNIAAIDEEGNELTDAQVLVNGIVPGSGGGGGGATSLDELNNVDVTGWLEGTFADRPATGDVAVGVRYWATDRQLAYRNTSNGWDVVGGTGTASNPIPEQHVESFNTDEGQSNRWETRTNDLVEYTTDGAWTWFNDHGAHENGKTFSGWVNSDGDIVAGSYDHGSETFTSTTLQTSLEADDHNAPGIEVQSDGTVTYAYTAHSGDNIYVRNSSSTYDVSSFGSEQTLSPSTAHTYPLLHQLDDGTIYLFYRNGPGNLAYIYSTDGGSSWSSESELVTQSGHAAYFQVDSDGSRIDIALSHSVEYQDGPKEDVRHVYFDGSSLRGTGGSALTPPINIDEATLIYDSSAAGNHDSWVWDCVQHAPDNIEVTFAEFKTPEKHVYRYAHWDGSTWSHHRVCDGGSYIGTGANSERYYSGGVVLDKETPGRLFVSVSDANTSAIQEWRTEDNGTSWRYTDYAAGTGQAVRPVVPRNRHDELEVLYMEGNYQYYMGGGYETAIRGGKSGTTPQSSSHTPGIVRAYTNDSISVSSGSFTPIPFNETILDARNELDATANEIVVEESGVYLVEASIAFYSVDAGGEYLGEVYVNGDEALATDRSRSDSGDNPVRSGVSVLYLDKGDTITFEAYQDSGNSQTIITERKSTHLHLYQLR